MSLMEGYPSQLDFIEEVSCAVWIGDARGPKDRNRFFGSFVSAHLISVLFSIGLRRRKRVAVSQWLLAD